MKQYYRFDENGFYIEPVIANYSEENPMPEDVTDVAPPNGLYKAKWDGKNWIETGSPIINIEEEKVNAIIKTKQWVINELEKPIDFKDKKYSVTLEKQNLLSAQLGLFVMNMQAGIQSTLTWNAAGESCVEWSFEDLLTLSNTIALHVAPIVKKQQIAEININKCETYEEIQEIASSFIGGDSQ